MSHSWTEKNARARSRRKIKAARHKVTRLIEDLAYEWGEVDQTIVTTCDEMLAHFNDACDDVEKFMNDRVEGDA